jgi:hypothetical protein
MILHVVGATCFTFTQVSGEQNIIGGFATSKNCRSSSENLIDNELLSTFNSSIIGFQLHS